jgi:hypothetical protein
MTRTRSAATRALSSPSVAQRAIEGRLAVRFALVPPTEPEVRLASPLARRRRARERSTPQTVAARSPSHGARDRLVS